MFNRIKNICQSYNQSIGSNQISSKGISSIHDAVGKILFKLGVFSLIVLFIGGLLYFAFQKATDGNIDLFKDMNSVPFDLLQSDKFKINIDGYPAIVTVNMGEATPIRRDMIGGEISFLPDAFLFDRKAYLVRSFHLIADVQSTNSKSIHVDRNFIAIKKNDGMFAVVPTDLFKEFMDEKMDVYRENLRKEAEAFLRNKGKY